VVILVVPGEEAVAAEALAAGATECAVKAEGYLTLLPALLEKSIRHHQRLLEHGRSRHEVQRALATVKSAQDQLVRGATLRALGEMTGGAAHDLNNLLTAVVTRLQVVMPSVVSANLRRSLQSAERAAIDAAEVVRRLQRFARIMPREARRLVDLTQVAIEVRQITKVLWQDLAHVQGLSIEVALESGTVPPVMGNEEALREALTNLVLNAIDALPEGGRITLRTFASESWVCLAVSDTGVGMSEEVKLRAREPMFTTKGPAGAGLGLSVVSDVTLEHGGELDIESAEGNGTTITIRLPRLPQRREEARPAPAAAPAAPVRVLLIDDDPEVRGVMDEMLAYHGCKVVTAAGGREALEMLKSGPSVDLVLTDLGMPEVTGLDVARAIAAEWPDLPVALITGWAEGLTLAPDDRKHIVRVLPKPVTEKAIRELLATYRS
jgi:signal transduction histidine kinase